MPSIRRSPRPLLLPTLALIALLFSMPGCGSRAEVERARSQVRQIVQQLDKKTDEKGIYIRAPEGDTDHLDPWGKPIQVSYSQGGVMETLTVTSAGPDRLLHTDDDIRAFGVAVNFKGVGEGIRKNAEETSRKAAKGVVKGTADAIKDSVKDALPRKKKPAESDEE